MKRLSFVPRRLLGPTLGLCSILALSSVGLGATSTVTATTGQSGATSSASARIGHGAGGIIGGGTGGVGSNSNSSGTSPDTDGDGMPDDWENNNGTDPNSDDGGGDFDDDGLTNAQEQEYSTYPWNAYSDADTKNDGEDGWALDKDMEPPRLSDASYVVIELGNGITSVVDMNNKGELLVIKGSGSSTEVGVWKAGTFTALSTDAGRDPTDVPIAWRSINDSGTVAGVRHFTSVTAGQVNEFAGDGDIYKISAGGSPQFVYGHYIPNESNVATPADWSPAFAWDGTYAWIDNAGAIYAFAAGSVEDDAGTGVGSWGPVKFAGGTPNELTGFRTSSSTNFGSTTWTPPINYSQEVGIEGVNSEGILFGAMGSGSGGILDGSTVIALENLGGPNSFAQAISDGEEPFVAGASNGNFAIWQKKDGTWKKAYDGAEKGSQISGYPIGVSARGELVGNFTGPDGTSGTIVRNGKVVDASKFPEGYTFSAAPAAGRRITKDGVAVVMGSEGGGMARSSGGSSDTLEELVPVEITIVHTEKERDVDGNELATTVHPGKDTLLRDEIADLKIKIPPLGNTDWDLKIDVEPGDVKTQALGNRGTVQMYDFGTVNSGTVTPLTETNGSTQAGPYDIKLLASKDGEETFKVVVNKEGKFKIRLKSLDNANVKIDVVSQEFTVEKRIRKYGKDTPSATYDFNKHDRHFEDAAKQWGQFYQYEVDDVERLKAIGMTESELGRNPQNQGSRPNDIMTIGHPDDHVLDCLRFVSGYQEKEVVPQSNTVRDLNYPQAAASPAGTAILWGTCWLYHKAQRISNNPSPPPSLVPGPWRSWDDATARYNGGGVNNYLDRVTRAFKEGRHPTDQTTIWPELTNGRARK